jgi:membrane protein DedA with SNARE-associated domain
MSTDSIIAAAGLFARSSALLAYLIVYVATVLSGNISAFIAFWISFATNLEKWRVLLLLGIVAAGEVTGDCFWFGLGHGLRNTRLGSWVERRVPGHAKAESTLHRKGRRFLYLSKFAYGSAGLVVFSLGWTGMQFRCFFKNSVISVLIALPVVFFTAYGLFSGISPLAAVAVFKHVELLFLIGIVAFLILEWLLSKLVKALFPDNGNGNCGEGFEA